MENKVKEEEIISASAVANYLFEHEKLKGKITNLFLQKAIYFIHSFGLCFENLSIVNEEFGEYIEAWKFGAVIPSIYHEFKNHKGNIIEGSYSILSRETITNGEEYIKPIIKNNQKVVKIIDWVCDNIFFENERMLTADELIDIIHAPNSPWQQVYNKNIKNIKISNPSIKHYFEWYYKWLLKNTNAKKF